MDLLQAKINSESQSYTRYAHSYIGLGLTPVAAVELNKTSLNAIKELWIVIRTFYKFRPFKLSINGKIVKLDSILFANIGQMAKILTIAKNASPFDGQFEVISFPHSRKLKLIKKLSKATFKGLKPKKYKVFNFIVIKKMPAQFDGEVVYFPPSAEVEISMLPQFLKTIV